MENPIENYWNARLAELKEALTTNNFDVFIAENADEAKSIALEKIIPEISPKSISWGGSMTFVATGLYDVLKSSKDFEVLDTYDKSLSPWKWRLPAGPCRGSCFQAGATAASFRYPWGSGR